MRAGLHISVRQILAHGRLTPAASVRPWTLAGNPKSPLMQLQRTIMILAAEQSTRAIHLPRSRMHGINMMRHHPDRTPISVSEPNPRVWISPNMLQAVSEWPIRAANQIAFTIPRVRRRQPLPHRYGGLPEPRGMRFAWQGSAVIPARPPRCDPRTARWARLRAELDRTPRPAGLPAGAASAPDSRNASGV
jgi:hypothetical protein